MHEPSSTLPCIAIAIQFYSGAPDLGSPIMHYSKHTIIYVLPRPTTVLKFTRYIVTRQLQEPSSNSSMHSDQCLAPLIVSTYHIKPTLKHNAWLHGVHLPGWPVHRVTMTWLHPWDGGWTIQAFDFKEHRFDSMSSPTTSNLYFLCLRQRRCLTLESRGQLI